MDRTKYTDETYTTIRAVEGKTIEWIGTRISFLTNEVIGFRLHFTDGTSAVVNTPADTPVDFARSYGLYSSERQAI